MMVLEIRCYYCYLLISHLLPRMYFRTFDTPFLESREPFQDDVSSLIDMYLPICLVAEEQNKVTKRYDS